MIKYLGIGVVLLLLDGVLLPAIISTDALPLWFIVLAVTAILAITVLAIKLIIEGCQQDASPKKKKRKKPTKS